MFVNAQKFKGAVLEKRDLTSLCLHKGPGGPRTFLTVAIVFFFSGSGYVNEDALKGE